MSVIEMPKSTLLSMRYRKLKGDESSYLVA